MIVYVLFHETNSGHSDSSDGYVEAIYATEEAAEAARLAEIRKARDEGQAIWCDPDDEDDAGDIFWEHDWVVYAHEVLERHEPEADEPPNGQPIDFHE